MKTRKTILTAVLLLLAVFAVFAQQPDPESDFEVEVIDNGRAIRITGYNGNRTAVNIPPRIRNLPVTEIGVRASSFDAGVFEEKELISVIIPNGVIVIGNAAFSGNHLTSITIPSSVTFIGNWAFWENQLTNVIIPSGVTSIGAEAFANNQLANVTIGNSVATIGNVAFQNNHLSSVTIPNSVTSIGGRAFNGNRLASVTIGNRVETIGDRAFENNQLTGVTIPNSVTSIGAMAFSGNRLASVNIPANVTIARDAFDGGIAEMYSQRGRRAFHFEQGLAFNVTLPANNPRQADLVLGTAVFQELQVHRFLGDTAAAGRHEAVLQFITGRGNATRAEVEAFYRNGIRGLISATVDEEFNRISFRIARHNAILTRNPQNGHYTLSYGGVNTNNETRVVTANSLEALVREMQGGNNRNDFTPADLNTVRNQAALIPAVVLSNAALNEIKNILSHFCTAPNTETYAAVIDVSTLYMIRDTISFNEALRDGRTPDRRYIIVLFAYHDAIDSINTAFGQRVRNDPSRTSITTLSREQQQRLMQLR